MTTYLLYPFYDDESATVFSEPIITVEADQPPSEITEVLLRDILVALGMDKEKAEAMSYGDLADAVWEEHTLILDSCAVIEDDGKVVEFLKETGDALMEGCGSDSCWYKASEAFSRILKNRAVVVLDFPFPSEDVF